MTVSSKGKFFVTIQAQRDKGLTGTKLYTIEMQDTACPNTAL